MQHNDAVICPVVDNMCEIEPDYLRLDEIIGEGQFGDVYRGTYTALVCNSILTLSS